MPSTPSLWRERTALAWQRSGLSLAVVGALLLRRPSPPVIAATVALAAAGALAARQRLGPRALALVTTGAAVIAGLAIIGIG